MKRTILVGILAGMTAVGMARAADIKETWDKECKKCHGAEGKGDTKMGKKFEVKDYSSAAVQDKLKDAEMIKAIKEGARDKDGKERMKAYGETLNDEQIKALVAQVRSFKK